MGGSSHHTEVRTMGFFGDLFEDSGLSDLLSVGQWKTLSNGKRVKLDSDGRIVAGLPSTYHGVHVADLSKLTHQERELNGIDCAEAGHCHTCKKTFRSKDEAYAAILEANPRLAELRESEHGSYDLEFVKWQRGGRRGPKPRTPITDGRLDAINEHYDLKGVHRVGSFTEAIYHAIPRSKRWADLDARLAPLSEAAGFEVGPPEEAIRLRVAALDREACESEVDKRLTELFEAARVGRLPEKNQDVESVPF